MIQICQNCNPFNLVYVLFKVIIVMIRKRLAKHPSIISTHLLCEVILNELMNGKIFLHWLPSKEMEATSLLWVQWFWRVVIWLLIEVDIPQLSSSGIQFVTEYYRSFTYIYSLQSSSIHSFILSSFDALALDMYIMSKSSYTAFDLSRLVIASNTDLVIPNDYFDRVGVTSFNISDNMILRRIEIGNNTFRTVRVFELTSKIQTLDWYTDLPLLQSVKLGNETFRNTKSFVMSNLTSLQSIEFGDYCFQDAPSFSLIGTIDWME